MGETRSARQVGVAEHLRPPSPRPSCPVYSPRSSRTPQAPRFCGAAALCRVTHPSLWLQPPLLMRMGRRAKIPKFLTTVWHCWGPDLRQEPSELPH